MSHELKGRVTPNCILTSSFQAVARELLEKSLLPTSATVAFIPTASDPYPERPWVDADRQALRNLGYHLVEVDLKNTAEHLQKALVPCNILFVAGGNTTYLAEYAHRANVSSVVRDFLQQGKMYIGSSAGSILAGPSVEPFLAEDRAELPNDVMLTNPSCLSLVNYVVLPHDQVEQFSAADDKIIKRYEGQWTFVRLTDQEYRVERITTT